MKAWVNKNQAEFHIDNVEISGKVMTVVMHHHFGEPKTSKQDNAQTATIKELERHRVFVTLAVYMQVKGLEEGKADLITPAERGGDGAKI